MDHLVLKWTTNFRDITIYMYCDNIMIIEIEVNILGSMRLHEKCVKIRPKTDNRNLVPRLISTLCSPAFLRNDLCKYCLFYPLSETTSHLGPHWYSVVSLDLKIPLQNKNRAWNGPPSWDTYFPWWVYLVWDLLYCRVVVYTYYGQHQSAALLRRPWHQYLNLKKKWSIVTLWPSGAIGDRDLSQHWLR